jgi:hypothetical protein
MLVAANLASPFHHLGTLLRRVIGAALGGGLGLLFDLFLSGRLGFLFDLFLGGSLGGKVGTGNRDQQSKGQYQQT